MKSKSQGLNLTGGACQNFCVKSMSEFLCKRNSSRSKTRNVLFSSGSLDSLKGFPLEKVCGQCPLSFSQVKKLLKPLIEMLQLVVFNPASLIPITNRERFFSVGISPTYLCQRLM